MCKMSIRGYFAEWEKGRLNGRTERGQKACKGVNLAFLLNMNLFIFAEIDYSPFLRYVSNNKTKILWKSFDAKSLSYTIFYTYFFLFSHPLYSSVLVAL